MRIPFVKMHGLGNDFVVIDARDGDVPALDAARAAAIANRNEGIGCDQIVVLENSDVADLRMRIYNRDGSEAAACGNAARAVALFHGREATVETAGGTIRIEPTGGGAGVDMGRPRFDWDAIPLAMPMDTLHMPVAWETLIDPAAVNVGNPHVVIFVPDADAVDLARLGPNIESDPLFTDRVNVNVASIDTRHRVRLRVWERGAGLTRACGTGACATAVTAIRRKLADSPVTVVLPGGELQIAWTPGGTISMSGPATESFRGSFAWDDMA